MSVPKLLEDYNLDMARQTVERNDEEFKNYKTEMLHQERYRDLDLFGSKQEIVRRGIETLMNIIRTQQSISSTGNVSGVSQNARTAADEKLKEFIKELKIPA